MPTTSKQPETVTNTPSGMRVSFLICLLFFVGWLASMTIVAPNNPLSQSLNNAAHFPFDSSAHNGLSQMYMHMMRLEPAKNELLVAKVLSPDVLGDSVTNRLDQEISSLPQKTETALDFWKEVASNNPQYSAGLVQQIYYYYNSGDFESAKRHANTLEFLDRRAFEKLPEELHFKP